MKHKHHIIPRHMGGSNDPSNIERITVSEHANRHYALWEMYGYKQDWLAWKALSGQIGKEEIQSMRSALGGKKTGGWHKGQSWSKEIRGKISNSHIGKKRSEESKKKQSKSVSGKKNHFYNKNHTEESRDKMRKPKSFKLGRNPRAFKISYLGSIYNSMKEMSKETGFSMYRIYKLIEQNKAVRIT